MWKSPRVEAYQEGEADEARQLELDSVEEARVNTLTQSARYLQEVRRYHDRNVQQRSFNIVWQNHLNYSGSSALAITIKATPTQTHFKRNNSWSVCLKIYSIEN